MQLPSSSAQEFGNKLRRMGGTPTQPQSTAAVKPSGGMTPWGGQLQGGNDRSGGRGGFGQPNPQAMQGRTFNSPWSLQNQSPKAASQLAAGNSPFPGFEPQTGGPNLQFPRPNDIIPPGPPGGSYGPPDGLVPRERPNDIIPPGPPGGSYGPVENRPPYIPPGPAGQSYGPVEGFNPGPYNPEAKPGQITGAIPQNFGQLFPGASPLVQQTLSRMAIPPGPAGQSYGPVEGGKPPVDRSWLRTEGLRRPQIQDEYDVW